MGAFIAKMVMTQADSSLEKGQAKYRAYFVNTGLYAKWQQDVNTILTTEGYADCIVTE